jgi:SPP1 gp7 family putative phage head morphogenesis protein
MIKSQIQTRIATLNGSAEQQMTAGLSTASQTMYTKSIFDLQQEIGYAFPFQKSTDQMIKTILDSNWSGKHWSQRLWTDNRLLADNLVKTLTLGISQGKSYYAMARDLKDEMNTGEYQAVRLIRTEATFVANQAKLIALVNSGVDEFEYVAVLDARTSEVCQDHDGAIVKAEEAGFGLNLPPLHPNCRSTFVARIPDEMKANLKRTALNPITGEKDLIPRSMTYKEWKQSLYDKYGRSETNIAVKKIKNLRDDSAQYEVYKNVVGSSNIPDSLDAFQDMKYTRPKDWWLLKGYKNAIRHGDISSLVGLDVYRSTAEKIETDLVGITTSDGILVTGYQNHFIDRVIGQIEAGTAKSGYRSGVKIEDCIQSLLSPGKIKTSSNGESRLYDGLKAAVTLNPISGTLIHTNPRSKND